MANLVMLMGRATADPDIRYSQGASSTCVAHFTLAVDRRFKRDGEPAADFFKCVAFGKTAESIEKYWQKGTKVLLTGSIQNDNYEKDGVKHYSVKIMVDSWEFAESKAAAAGEEKPKNTDSNGFMNIPTGLDDELPFK